MVIFYKVNSCCVSLVLAGSWCRCVSCLLIVLTPVVLNSAEAVKVVINGGGVINFRDMV